MALSVLRFGTGLRVAQGAAFRACLPVTSVACPSISSSSSACGVQQVVQVGLLPRTSPFAAVAARCYGKRAPEHGRAKKLDDDSDSDSDSDDDRSKKLRGESEFWRRKMRTLHGLLDLNKDGVISYDDYKLLADRFVDLGHLSAQDTQEFHKAIQQMWEEQWGSLDAYNLVTTEQYLAEMQHMVNDKSLKKKAHLFLPYLFKAVDKDKSGEISVEEFKIFFQCLGLTDQDATNAFNVIDTNTDGRLSSKEFVKLGRDFFLTEDPRRPSKMFWGPLVP
ncbi:sarcoplasmic calcium-binding protein [Frankliniella occidentalis]|uniref:Sarcoplasmic calcium-binding protein n=1 Tax=Frankliniella occidentalis TaxID=133901 RepID=A0A6J1SHW2_FRAOC|nr:sarcoplasmic calcium-binding protein [Frankliniella occidentalis]